MGAFNLERDTYSMVFPGYGAVFAHYGFWPKSVKHLREQIEGYRRRAYSTATGERDKMNGLVAADRVSQVLGSVGFALLTAVIGGVAGQVLQFFIESSAVALFFTARSIAVMCTAVSSFVANMSCIATQSYIQKTLAIDEDTYKFTLMDLVSFQFASPVYKPVSEGGGLVARKSIGQELKTPAGILTVASVITAGVVAYLKTAGQGRVSFQPASTIAAIEKVKKDLLDTGTASHVSQFAESIYKTMRDPKVRETAMERAKRETKGPALKGFSGKENRRALAGHAALYGAAKADVLIWELTLKMIGRAMNNWIALRREIQNTASHEGSQVFEAVKKICSRQGLNARCSGQSSRTLK